MSDQLTADKALAAVNVAPTQFLTFWLGDEVLGMDIRTVREIIQCGPMATVPLMPTFLRGIINLRGAVVPVIDLNARFGRPASALSKKSCIVIFDAKRGGERAELGLLVDAVSEVLKIGPDQIEAPPDFGTSVRRDFIMGIGKVGKRFVILLEPDRALDVQEMAELCDNAQASLIS
ncbi:MAG: purine-binding chemotaxis protein CheW [Aquabacterium sp.]|uniref:chemotaxis protein CheW n=1 Tax=Aquabacterium sp. TaxID=1872578 RepID=UPI00120617BA|nr:chemotaxis protein CheW [Aquabacterium sp.]TAK97681.1 MAG: purine-binding chemotaxis protein CheW [Aquabacterium sp.]